METNMDAITKIINYMEDNMSDNPDLDKIADIAGYSKYHLSRMFANAMGCTIHRYIQRRRLTEAARQLVFTGKSIADIAFAAGYETQQSFTLAFKRLYKDSPYVYRKKKEFWPIQLKHTMRLKYQEQKKGKISYGKYDVKCEVRAA